MKLRTISLLSLLVLIIITFTLVACSKTSNLYKFFDSDGTLLHEVKVSDDLVPSYELPMDTEMWDYISWEATNSYEMTAKREPQYNYFIGNVFQIIVYDLGYVPISTGSGFVFNEDGWFITNNHVMDEGYYAEAIFDIRDSTKGESFTKLDIDLVSYQHSDKDIFIGKLTNYSKIGSEYYKEFSFSTQYLVGDLTYSVGYPNSSIKLEINKGYVQSDLSSIYDKVYSGITYIGSTSFIAPGSSGGILLNSNLEVLGMTTIGISDNNGNFILGGAIEAFNFINQISNVSSNSLKNYALFLHPDEAIFINFFKNHVSKNNKFSKTEMYDWVRYTWKFYDEVEFQNTIEQGGAGLKNGLITVDSDGWIKSEYSIYWEIGDRMEVSFYGYYSHTEGFKDFTYEFKYTWNDGDSYSCKSTEINYSTNISLTLNKYTITKSPYNLNISQENIEYMKDKFNDQYEWFSRFINSGFNTTQLP